MSEPRSASVRQKLLERLQKKDALAFSEFLDIALYDPEAGYYTSGFAGVGRSGDFLTNVSMGPIYGLLLARWLNDQFCNTPDFSKSAVILEQGANDGQLAEDILSELFKINSEHDWNYWIIEPSPVLQKRQADRLSRFGSSVRWFSDIEELPDFCGIHISNELIDALPFDLVERKNGQWMERYVCEEDENFTLRSFAATPEKSSPEFLKALARLPQNADFPEPYYSEIRPRQSLWLQKVAKKLQHGRILICDYGYPLPIFYAPWRKNGTLQCYSQHKKNEDPFQNIGRQDISAHVDFTALAQDAQDAGFCVDGFSDQYHFLIRVGTNWLKSLEQGGLTPEVSKLLSAFKTLTHPESMGTQFHYLTLSKNLPSPNPLLGFESIARCREKLALF